MSGLYKIELQFMTIIEYKTEMGRVLKIVGKKCHHTHFRIVSYCENYFWVAWMDPGNPGNNGNTSQSEVDDQLESSHW